ncbi:carbohydrate ABC transporter permease [Microbacterium sp. NE2HP2]|uniref:carbohydrate ABC transporter permease n=1 Tax=Microbacterium TaxID=33882 RepID=UPI0023652E31|nr:MULTISPECIES: carbohydrate ABC transporter permease [Microbacterium]MDD7944289.1 carbohydrate ABC transporter permease [Microbacterium plantarum]WHE36621.1 carbohydrate ABC transporter permease [Microbacterium sp. BDGP8]WRK17864.1 carbohydrate ABC transporter permease [Microbacterium plantarum]
MSAATASSTATRAVVAPGVAPDPRSRKPGQRRLSALNIVAFVALALLAIGWLLPFLWAVATAFKTETDAASGAGGWIGESGPTTEAFTSILSQGNVWVWAGNSLWTSAVITLLTVAISAVAAYAFSRLEFRGKKFLYGAVIASIVIPPQVLIIPLFYEMLAFNLVDTPWGLILPQVVAPAMVFILKKFFDQVPIELEDAARVDGAGRFRVFWSIVLPLSRPILGAVAIFVFIGAWNNFLWPFLIINDTTLMTLPVGLQTVISAYGVQYAQVMAQAVLASVPLIIVFLVFQKQIVRGVATTGFGGQ